MYECTATMKLGTKILKYRRKEGLYSLVRIIVWTIIKDVNMRPIFQVGSLLQMSCLSYFNNAQDISVIR